MNLEGFKIGLEILVKARVSRSGGYPIVFKDRKCDQSKISGKVMFDYLRQLGQLYRYALANHRNA